MSSRKLMRGAKVGLFTLIDYVTSERWLCQCECGTREFRTFDALQDNRSIQRCGKCRSRRLPSRRTKVAKQDARSRAEELRRRLDEVATPARLQRLLLGRSLDTKAMLTELGIHCDKTALAQAAEWLRIHGCRKQVSLGRNTWEWAGVESRSATTPTAGPCLEVGTGEKRECARYEGCLVAFLKSFPNATVSRCPVECAYFMPLVRARLLRKAYENVSMAQRGANLGGVA